MLSAERVLDEYFLDTRCMLLEIAATLDRYDASVERDGRGTGGETDPRLADIRRALELLTGREAPAIVLRPGRLTIGRVPNNRRQTSGAK